MYTSPSVSLPVSSKSQRFYDADLHQPTLSPQSYAFAPIPSPLTMTSVSSVDAPNHHAAASSPRPITPFKFPKGQNKAKLQPLPKHIATVTHRLGIFDPTTPTHANSTSKSQPISPMLPQTKTARGLKTQRQTRAATTTMTMTTTNQFQRSDPTHGRLPLVQASAEMGQTLPLINYPTMDQHNNLYDTATNSQFVYFYPQVAHSSQVPAYAHQAGFAIPPQELVRNPFAEVMTANHTAALATQASRNKALANEGWLVKNQGHMHPNPHTFFPNPPVATDEEAERIERKKESEAFLARYSRQPSSINHDTASSSSQTHRQIQLPIRPTAPRRPVANRQDDDEDEDGEQYEEELVAPTEAHEDSELKQWNKTFNSWGTSKPSACTAFRILRGPRRGTYIRSYGIHTSHLW